MDVELKEYNPEVDILFDLKNDNDQIIDFIDSNSFLENNDKNKNKIEFNIHNESLDKYSTHFLNIG